MKPSVGRIVHYTNLGDKDGKYPPEAQAALLTKVTPTTPASKAIGRELAEENDFHVSLHIFYETGDFFMKDVPFSEAAPASNEARGHWGWPPRV